MTYGVVLDVDQPLEAYTAVHTELLHTTDGGVDGLLVHLARATARGFQVVEVWESREQAERYNRELAWPVMARLAGGRELPPPEVEEFEVAGLVLPGAGVGW